MRNDERDRRRLREALSVRTEEAPRTTHVVFDFTGLGRPNVGDLALILTARLQSMPEDNVWARSLPAHTARILEVLRLDHLFRHYPEDRGELN